MVVSTAIPTGALNVLKDTLFKVKHAPFVLKNSCTVVYAPKLHARNVHLTIIYLKQTCARVATSIILSACSAPNKPVWPVTLNSTSKVMIVKIALPSCPLATHVRDKIIVLNVSIVNISYKTSHVSNALNSMRNVPDVQLGIIALAAN